VAVDSRDRNAQAAAAQPQAQPTVRGFDVRPRQPGVFGEIAQMAGLRSADVAAQRRQGAEERGLDRAIRVRGQDASIATAAATNRVAAARAGMEFQKEAESALEKQVSAFSNARADAPGFVDRFGASNRDAAIKKDSAEVLGRIKYSIGDRKDGKTLSQLSEPEKQQLLFAEELRQRGEEGRSGWVRSLKSYFGNKRFDSRNLYKYLPVARDGNSIVLGTGEKVDLEALAKGGFNPFSPNDPVDADVQDLIRNLPQAGR
jgi:hypothetical protein